MPMPEGIVTVKIDRETGCPARAGQTNTMFEVFRADNVPDCERLEEIADPFNNAAGIDADQPAGDEEDEDDNEALF